MQPRSECPVCADGGPRRFLHRDHVAIHQNLLCETPAEARRLACGTLDLCVCERCGFVFNAQFDPSLLSYGDHYDNTQTHSPTFSRYVDDLVRRVLDDTRGSVTVVEVGCGKGDFLKRLVHESDGRVRGIGYDPTYEGPLEIAEGAIRFERSFYDERAASVGADVVVCRHVIEHIPEPVQLLRAVRGALQSLRARVYFETPCVDWILEHRVAWDFFYEHCSLFTAGSLSTAFELAGFDVERCDRVFGGQYLWLEARPALDVQAARARSCKPGLTANLAGVYRATELSRNAAWRALAERSAGQGRIALWGAGAKGATFAHLVDPEAKLLDCIVDMNPAKQGHYLPGTGHPIVAPDALAHRGVDTVLLTNPNYSLEIREWAARCCPSLQVVDLQQSQRRAA